MVFNHAEANPGSRTQKNLLRHHPQSFGYLSVSSVALLGQEIEDAVNHDEKLLPTFFLFLSPILHVSGMREETPWRHHGIKSTSPMRFLQGEALAVIYTVSYVPDGCQNKEDGYRHDSEVPGKTIKTTLEKGKGSTFEMNEK